MDVLFAADGIDAVPPWFGIIIQLGSFGVLAYLITVLLPKLRNLMAVERASELKSFADDARQMREDFKETLRDLTSTFKAEAMAERQACEKHFETLATAMGKGNEATVAAVRGMMEQTQSHTARNQQFIEALREKMDKGGAS